MSRIPMKGDPPSLHEIAAKYGHPADKLAEIYFEASDRADSAADTGDRAEARKMAEAIKRKLAEFGFEPVRVDGAPKAQPISRGRGTPGPR